MSLRVIRPEHLTFKNHPEYTEKWLQDLIVEDTSILGLGDLVVIERERRQEKAGRLDLLLADLEENRRYEVELQLGATDESHIMRSIEYWDIERRRYPAYDHCAVIVAEDITSRFLNLLTLFAGSIPMIAIQLNALKVEDRIVLDFVKVLDQTMLRRDDEVETALTKVDRNYWLSNKGEKTVGIADHLLEIMNEKASPQFQLNYNKFYIGLEDGMRSTTFVYFKPKKQFTHVLAKVAEPASWVERFEEGCLSASPDRSGYFKVTLKPAEIKSHRVLLTELLHKAVEEYQQ